MGELGGKGEETGEVSRRQQANEQEKVGRREKCSVGGRRGGDEGRRSVMKWQTACQTPHGSEILTHRLDGWKSTMERGNKENDQLTNQLVYKSLCIMRYKASDVYMYVLF